MRNYQEEFDLRVAYIQEKLRAARANAIVYGNSGGKDSALVGILCKAACADTLGLLLPCSSKQNYSTDYEDAIKVAAQFDIAYRAVDLANTLTALKEALNLPESAYLNLAPRLRMTAIYAAAADRNALVAGTGNRSEIYLGYFTKWGDGAYDFNPIGDLTATEVFDFLKFLNAPSSILVKKPSGGLFDGQTDEEEMGLTYADIDAYLTNGVATDSVREKMERMHARSAHKRKTLDIYNG